MPEPIEDEPLRGPRFCHEDGCPGEVVIVCRFRGPMWWAFCKDHYREGLQVVTSFLDEMAKRGKL